MNYDWAFLPMTASNQLVGCRSSLRERLDQDGYLYFSRLLDRERILRLRSRMLTTLRESKWVSADPTVPEGKVVIRPLREGSDEFLSAYHEIQKLEEFHTLAHDPTLLGLMRDILGDSAFPHPLKIARLIFPANYEVSTPPHQDFPNNQGTPDLTAAWIPVGDLPSVMGGLAILRGSHRWGVLPMTTHLGAGNRCAELPLEMLEQCRWVTTDFEAGDVLVFLSQTVHAARHNASELYMRLSADFRYQPQGKSLTPSCLEPHFGRLGWEEIYSGWQSREFQYYWRDLDYSVEPFEDLEVRGADLDADVTSYWKYQQRLKARNARRNE